MTNPVRVADSRPIYDANGACCNGSLPIGFDQNGGPTVAGPYNDAETRRYSIAGRTFNFTPIPADATGVLVNVSTIQGVNDPTGGFTVVYPGDAGEPLAATVNPLAPIPATLAAAVSQNFAVVGLSVAGGATPSGVLAVTARGQPFVRHVVIDLVGYFSPSAPPSVGELKFIPPVRALDTRPGLTIGFDGAGAAQTPGTINPNVVNQYRLAGKSFGSVAEGNQVTLPAPGVLKAVLAHITVVQSTPSGGFTTLLPGNAGAPTTATLNPSTAISFNSWATGVSATGNIGVFTPNSGSAAQHIIIDIMGYYSLDNSPTLGQLAFVNPVRVVDTRAAHLTGFNPDGTPISANPFGAASETRRYRLAGQPFGVGPNQVTLPLDLKGGLINVTIVQTQGPSGGFLTVFPGDANPSPPGTATVNPVSVVAGSWWASGIPTVPLQNPGTLGAFSTGDTRELIIDLSAYFR